MSAVRVFVAAGDDAARDGLEALLRGRRDVEVVGSGPAPGGGHLADPAGPDVVFWDPGAGGLARERLAAADAGGPPVVVLVADSAQAARALAGGAHGILPRDADPDVLAAAASAAAAGLVVLDPALAAPVARREPDPLVEDLTQREHQVLQLLAEGLANREIARRLSISEHTVNFHVDAILGKLGAHSRTEAVARAARLGLLIL
ncbi:MAG: response regulator transcription factor [Armatimonadota bacterium]|nr:response regulator transcription factor [Armatimonadota bacterium]